MNVAMYGGLAGIESIGFWNHNIHCIRAIREKP
jgi:hypothetical protein